MTEEKKRSLEGWVPDLGDEVALHAALEKAFDYRGDVTCELASGETLEGYLFNRDFHAVPPFIEIYPNQESAPARRLEVGQIRALRFTGRDMADGRSWEAWMQKWEAATGERASGAAEI